jgi:hypothetical protein
MPAARAAGIKPAAHDPRLQTALLDGRPVSQVTEDYLAWLCERFAAEGKRVFVLVWDGVTGPAPWLRPV